MGFHPFKFFIFQLQRMELSMKFNHACLVVMR